MANSVSMCKYVYNIITYKLYVLLECLDVKWLCVGHFLNFDVFLHVTLLKSSL